MSTSNFFARKEVGIVFFLLSCITFLNGQDFFGARSIAKGDIHALIIGVSDYKDERIKDLNFAHRDAEIFAEYLLSETGGSVPREQVKLFTNQNATISNIYVALKEIQDKAQKDDLVFFYFSGHGDVESGLYELGFLLAHDTPHKNYLNNAVRIEDINNMANSLSVEKDVEVILITDACHSGKLSGSDNRGSQLVGKQLRKVKNNEVRISSCDAEELAQEDTAWGGGRGAFSFHLINGMIGLADKDDMDEVITLQELRDYIQEKVSSDVFRLKQEEQTPVVDGKLLTPLAIVDPNTLDSLKSLGEQVGASVIFGGSRSIDDEKDASSQYFELLGNLENKFDFFKLNSMDKDQLVSYILEKGIGRNTTEEVIDWLDSVRLVEVERYRYEQLLGAMIHNEVQVVINNYLNGDKSEMEKRQYLNAKDDLYSEIVEMLGVAEKLIDPNNYLNEVIKVKKNYFKGLIARFRLGFAANPDEILKEAVENQEEALKYSGNASFVYNELGVLHTLMGKNEEAKKYYLKTLELVPNWSVALSNMSSICYKEGDFNEGIAYAERAIKVNPELFIAYINLGKNLYQQGDLLRARDQFVVAAKINKSNFQSYEHLAIISLEEGDVKSAAEYFELSRQNRLGLIRSFEVPDEYSTSTSMMPRDNSMPNFPNDVTSESLRPDASLFEKALAAKTNFKTADAIAFLKELLKTRPKDPLAYYYLADFSKTANDYLAADYYLKKAEQYHVDSIEIADYVSKHITNEFEASTYLEAYINKEKIDHLKIKIFERWSRPLTALAEYKNFASRFKDDYVYNFLHWDALIKLQRYYEAEHVVLDWYNRDESRVHDLISFYKTMIRKQPSQKEYSRKLGLLLYDHTIEKEVEKSKVKNRFPNPIKREANNMLSSEINPVYGWNLPTRIEYNNFYVEAIEHLEKSIDLSDSIDVATTYKKIADLYIYYGDIEKAYSVLDFALDYNKEEVGNLECFVETALKSERYSAAYDALKHLDRKNVLDVQQALHFIRLSNFKGDFKESEKKDSILSRIVLGKDMILRAHSEAVRLSLQKDYESSIEIFQDLAASPSLTSSNYEYLTARQYAKSGDKKRCLEYLEKAIKKGFSSRIVVINDPVMKPYKEGAKWEKLTDALR